MKNTTDHGETYLTYYVWKWHCHKILFTMYRYLWSSFSLIRWLL